MASHEASETQGAEGESFDSFPESVINQPTNEIPLNELHLLMRVEKDDGCPLPIGTYSERCVFHKINRVTGIVPERVRRVNVFDTVIVVAADVSVTAVAQALHGVYDWENQAVRISCIMGSSSYIEEVCRQRKVILEQQEELLQQQRQHQQALRDRDAEIAQQTERYEQELARRVEEVRSDTTSQQAAITELMSRLDEQAQMVSELRTAQRESIPRITSSLVTPDFVTEPTSRKMTRNPDLPTFSGEKPTPRGEVEYDNWIFQVKNLRKTYTDDAIRNGVVASVRGIANIIVRSAGYESTLDYMIECLDSKFLKSETDDCLLQEFHQMQQGSSERVLEYGSKLECKFRFLQERFPRRYEDSQLRDRFFSSVNDRTRDAIRHKHDREDCTFNELLNAAMKAEAETTSRAVRAKALNANDDTNADQGVTSIQQQLTSMTEILKGAQFQRKGQKGTGGIPAKAADAREGLKGPETSSAGPFKRGKPTLQCFRCMGWGHYARSCASKTAAKGSVEWENSQGEVPQEGGALPRDAPAHPK